jgi:hypothetical protein
MMRQSAFENAALIFDLVDRQKSLTCIDHVKKNDDANNIKNSEVSFKSNTKETQDSFGIFSLKNRFKDSKNDLQ